MRCSAEWVDAREPSVFPAGEVLSDWPSKRTSAGRACEERGLSVSCSSSTRQHGRDRLVAPPRSYRHRGIVRQVGEKNSATVLDGSRVLFTLVSFFTATCVCVCVCVSEWQEGEGSDAAAPPYLVNLVVEAWQDVRPPLE